MEKLPPFESSNFPKTGSLSGRGRQSQSIEPSFPTRAEIWQLPINPELYMSLCLQQFNLEVNCARCVWLYDLYYRWWQSSL